MFPRNSTELNSIDAVVEALRRSPLRWVVTGAAGFIGSNLAEELLRLGQQVVGLDNLATGYLHNVEDVLSSTSASDRFRFVQGDICDLATCMDAFRDADIVLHQAALGSVPRSIADPVATNRANVDGFINVLLAARDSGIRRVVYAGSSSVYGDHPALPKVEEHLGAPLSPYAASKHADELYAAAFGRVYGSEIIGLRYFNVFGPRQDPQGAYAAVIPKWIAAMLAGEPCVINGDGETSRDFCYIKNVVQANILSATTTNPAAVGQVYNIAVGERTTLTELFRAIRDGLAVYRPHLANATPVYGDFREGDVRHSLADITRASQLLGYRPTHGVRDGMAETLRWYSDRAGSLETVLG